MTSPTDSTSPGARIGGKSVIRLLIKGNQTLADVLLSTADGGHKLLEGLPEKVLRRTDGRVRLAVEREPSGSHTEFLAELASNSALVDANPPDILAMSLDPDVFDSGLSATEDYIATMQGVIRALKAAGVYVIAVNASTVDPTTTVSNYQSGPEPYSRRAMRLDLALLQLSVNEGISIVDADRVIAEMGAKTHVAGPLDYSTTASDAICEEFVEVMAACGFFDARPLMPQLGAEHIRA